MRLISDRPEKWSLTKKISVFMSPAPQIKGLWVIDMAVGKKIKTIDGLGTLLLELR